MKKVRNNLLKVPGLMVERDLECSYWFLVQCWSHHSDLSGKYYHNALRIVIPKGNKMRV